MDSVVALLHQNLITQQPSQLILSQVVSRHRNREAITNCRGSKK